MKTGHHALRILALLTLFILGIATGAASAADMPKRKPGLWETNMQINGAPNMGAIQQCIDASTDNIAQQQAGKQKSDCSATDVKSSGNQVNIHTVCKIEGSTATTDGVFEGSFDSNYQGSMKTRYSPPLHGMSESNISLQARWLSPCKPGQKPGDVIMPNLGGVNVNDMMKDPKVQEMMKRQQQR